MELLGLLLVPLRKWRRRLRVLLVVVALAAVGVVGQRGFRDREAIVGGILDSITPEASTTTTSTAP